MGIGSVLAIVALLILVALFIVQPLLKGEELGPGTDPQRSHWLAERERILDALLELDFDHELDKVPEDVYRRQRQQLMAQGAEALMALDELGEEGADIEETLAARRDATSDAALEKLIRRHKKARRQ